MEYLCIDKNEVLRYLGYKNQIIDESIMKLIEESIDEMKNLANIRYTYKYFDISKEINKVFLKESIMVLKGKDIYNHLSNSERCILMAATLGNAVDKEIRLYEKKHITKGLILDACANVAIEEICDNLCDQITEIIKKDGKKLTSRYSPGYGDLSLEIQREFISVLEADKIIGLNVSSNNILIPRKSVTAVVGIVNKEEIIQNKSCYNCNNYSSCEFKRGEDCCEY